MLLAPEMQQSLKNGAPETKGRALFGSVPLDTSLGTSEPNTKRSPDNVHYP